VRSADVVQIASVETMELFPDISIGDAPAPPGEQIKNKETAKP